MPRIHMTRTVKIALYGLRVYLILLLGLIVLKFVLLFSDGNKKEAPVTSAPQSSHIRDSVQHR